MLTFESQEKIIGALLQKPGNKACADCGASSPTCTSLVIQGLLLISEFLYVQIVLGPTGRLDPQ